MELKYFSSWDGALPMLLEVRIILAAHLIADSFILGGEPALALSIDKKKHKLTQEEKINFVYSHALAEGAEDLKKEVKELIEAYYEEKKSIKNNISASKTRFVIVKKLESTLTAFFDSFVKDYENELDVTAIPKLRKALESYPINNTKLPCLSRIMVTNKPPKQSKVAKEILDFMFNTHTKGAPASLLVFDNIFMLPIMNELDEEGTDFIPNELSALEIPQTIEDYYKVYENTPNFDEKWLNITASFPFINELNELEILMLKKDMQQPISAFNAAADQWVACRKNANSTKELLALTHVGLIEAGKQLEATFKNQPLCKPNGNNDALIASYYQLIFFTMSVDEIWSYYERLEMLAPDIITEMRNITLHNAAYPKELPVLGINIKNDVLFDMAKEFEQKPQVVTTKKKSIDFD